MKFLTALTSTIAALALSGCGTSAILDKTAKDPGEVESILIFKVSPANYRLMFFPGTTANGRFKQNAFLGAEINGLPKDGYVVAKAKAGQTLGLTTIAETKEGSVFGSKVFKACGAANALVFDVPKTRVAYLTDIEYERVGNKVSIRYRQDMEAAVRHIRANYPEIKADIQPLEFRILPADLDCGGGTVVIPIYIKK